MSRFLADSGFCRHRMFDWCDKNGIDCIVGIAKNPRLLKLAKRLINEPQSGFDTSGQKQRLFADLVYAVDSWRYARRVIAKAEQSRKGSNPRFVVTGPVRLRR